MTATSIERRKRDLAMLTVAALGVVYGDIGTSPLYTLRECFAGHHPMALTTGNILGILSLIFWSLIVVVTFKYVMFIMRADNDGAGGVLALLALSKRVPIGSRPVRHFLVIAGIFGAALFFGDAMITPAISVLSAVEMLGVAAPALGEYVIPVTLAVLIVLFLVQSKGTAKVGAAFGPIMILWFLVLAGLGIASIAQTPEVLRALNPYYAALFFYDHGWASVLVFGSVVLAVTGGEALYADMGHFGRKTIQYAWFGLVLPALVLNYFGQGALLLRDASAIQHPFFHLAPDVLQWPLLLLSVAATVIASQAVISGVFSITREAVQLQFWPRVLIAHTSKNEEGQIYVPSMNWFLLGSVILLVLGFRTSSNLAAAYGIAVTAAMMVDTILVAVVARGLWRWSWATVIGIGASLLIVDCAFLFSNMLKFFAGGWFPILVGVVGLVLMLTWRRGRKLISRKLGQSTMLVSDFVESLRSYKPMVVPGTAVFMTSAAGRVPYALLHNIRHNKVLHKRNIFLTVNTERVPHVPDERRVKIEELGDNFFVVNAWFGFQESPDVLALLRYCASHGLDIHENDTSFFINRDRLIESDDPGMPAALEGVFMAMHRNAMSATDYFNIPSNRVVELGAQIEI